ncbi:MFS transporter [Trinickia dinghuensis]|uniref:MFS transporter n=1 Tax=Trinickia dinghuensis TaxID=2291023 RepID=A0A3D8JRW7_9BURK|nr:MFS transporter [Trinickia dinghuensis]RDU95859.1 MFS transporter [Trinickia dinghuensis]
MSETVFMEDLPLRKFHFRVVLAGGGGQFSDGFILGIIGIAVSIAAKPMHLDAMWLGLIAAAALAGIFLGSICTGPFADRFGRRGIFAYDMIAFAAISAAQYFVTAPWQLLVFRVALGFILGADYAVGKSLVVEYLPRRFRGSMTSMLAVCWGSGYVLSYYIGYLIQSFNPEGWRLMLAVSGIPALLILPLRLGIPESPMWLLKRKREKDAAAIVRETFGSNVVMDNSPAARETTQHTGMSSLFSRGMRRNTFVGCVFFTCQVIPYFALGTFSPRILQALHVGNGFMAAMVYNALLICGTLVGVAIIDRIPRRSFLVTAFYASAAALAALALVNGSAAFTIAAFGVFACILSASTTLEPVYTAELFPTELRATGAGFVIACSRIGSASATFLLPLAVQHIGIKASLLFCVGTLVVGGVICQMLAPETRNKKLAEVANGNEAATRSDGSYYNSTSSAQASD